MRGRERPRVVGVLQQPGGHEPGCPARVELPGCEDAADAVGIELCRHTLDESCSQAVAEAAGQPEQCGPPGGPALRLGRDIEPSDDTCVGGRAKQPDRRRDRIAGSWPRVKQHEQADHARRHRADGCPLPGRKTAS